MLNSIKKFIFLGLTEEDSLRDRSRSAVFTTVGLSGALILFIYTIYDFIIAEYQIAILTGAATFVIVSCVLFVYFSKKLNFGAVFLSYVAYILFSLLIYGQGTERAGYFWMLLYPLVSIFFMGRLHGIISSVLFGITSYLLIFIIPGINDIPFNQPMALRVYSSYIGIGLFTIAFEIIRVIVFNKLEETADTLSDRIDQIRIIFENVNQGIFVLDEGFIISKERSDFFNTTFNLDANEESSFLNIIADRIPERDFVAAKDYLELFFNKTVNPELLQSINPLEKIQLSFNDDDGTVQDKWFEFGFQKIARKKNEVVILGMVKDITDQVILEQQLEQEEVESSKAMENLFQIIHISPELMEEFIRDTEDEIDKINEMLKVEKSDTESVLNYMFTIIHGVKGNALLLGLNNFSQSLRSFEEYIKDLKKLDINWQELLKVTVNLAEIKHDLNGIKTLIEKIVGFQSKYGNGKGSKKVIFEESLKRSITKLSKEMGKSVNLNADNYDVNLIPEKYRRLLKNVINQFVRNSLAHGIEDPVERSQKSKEPDGNIYLELTRNDKFYEFRYRDDGRGLSVDRIKTTAIEKKGYSKTQIEKMSGSEIIKLIFSPGFSTSTEVDNIAGQGVGMNVVKENIDKAGGKLNIKSARDKFCEFKILLPA